MDRQENRGVKNNLGLVKNVVIKNKDSKVDETGYIDVDEHEPEQYRFFSHFDDDTGEGNIDTIALKKSLKSVAGETRELAAKRGKADSNDWKSVIISIAGKEFRTKMKNLKRFPKSRLGKVALAKSKEEVSELCDGFIPGNPPVIFFYRNPITFRAVLDVYRRREVHICEQSCPLIAQEDFDFWQLEETLLEPCCALKYFPQIVSAQVEKREEQEEIDLAEQKLVDEDFGSHWAGRMRTKFWDMLEYPETSHSAQAVAFFSMLFVCLSTVTFVIESSYGEDVEYDDEQTDKKEENTGILTIMQYIDQLAITFFTLEYFLRLLLCPKKKKFIMDYMNLGTTFIKVLHLNKAEDMLNVQMRQFLWTIGSISKKLIIF